MYLLDLQSCHLTCIFFIFFKKYTLPHSGIYVQNAKFTESAIYFTININISSILFFLTNEV